MKQLCIESCSYDYLNTLIVVVSYIRIRISLHPVPCYLTSTYNHQII